MIENVKDFDAVNSYCRENGFSEKESAQLKEAGFVKEEPKDICLRCSHWMECAIQEWESDNFFHIIACPYYTEEML